MQENIQNIAAISPNDLRALTNILHFYERWLQNTIDPSVTGNKQCTEIQLLIIKIGLLGNSNITVLTYDEVEHITSAIKVFVQQVSDKIPPSENRNEILESCEGLHSYIVATFASKQKPDD